MQFCLIHPDDPHVVSHYGWTVARGYWAEVHCGQTVVALDATTEGYDVDFPVHSVLDLMSEYGFIAADDARAAFGWLHTAPGCGRRRLRGGVRRVLRIISNMERVSG